MKKSNFISLLLLVFCCTLPILTPQAWAGVSGCSTIVINTNDSGEGSLREAINCANSTPGAQTITFDIPGVGLKTITPNSALPAITDTLTIDGYSQPGTSPNTNGPTQGTNAVLRIEINLANAGGLGLRISADNCIVRGLVINRSPNDGIDIGSFGGNSAGAGSVVEGCFIGTDNAGTATNLGNGGGVGVFASNAINSTLVGGTTPAARNLISGNGNGILIGVSNPAVAAPTNARVQGNLIGTTAAGTTALSATSTVGVSIFDFGGNHLIGGATPAARNVISGHSNLGVTLGSIIVNGPLGGNKIQGNFIGLDVTGRAAIPNRVGVLTDNQSANNFIGGTGAGEGNVISGNTAANVQLGSAGNMVQGNRIGTNAAGTAAPTGVQPSAFTVGVSADAGSNTVGGTAQGAGNTIAFNTAYGVLVGGITVSDPSIQNVSILGNSIFSNGQIGINLLGKDGPGGVTFNNQGPFNVANRGQNFPVITGTAGNVISATFNAEARKVYRLEFFASNAPDPTNFGEGQTFLGFVNKTTDGAGNTPSFTFNSPIAIDGKFISATATDPAGNTSEFSGAVEARGGALPSLSVNDVTVTEGNTGTTNAIFTLTLSRAANGPVTVNFATRDNEAVAPGDYTAINRTATIPAGQTTSTVSVPVVGDNIEENNELFTVVLTNPQGATLAKATGNGTIRQR